MNIKNCDKIWGGGEGQGGKEDEYRKGNCVYDMTPLPRQLFNKKSTSKLGFVCPQIWKVSYVYLNSLNKRINEM